MILLKNIHTCLIITSINKTTKIRFNKIKKNNLIEKIKLKIYFINKMKFFPEKKLKLKCIIYDDNILIL
jgi:hypothetical protein